MASQFSPSSSRKLWYAIQFNTNSPLEIGGKMSFLDDVYVDRHDAELDVEFRHRLGSPYRYKIIPVEPDRALRAGLIPVTPKEAREIRRHLDDVRRLGV